MTVSANSAERPKSLSTILVRDTYKNVIKRNFDLLLSLAAIILLSPMLLVISTWIKLTSKGPVVYKQGRVGKDGKPFTLYKFRSMTLGADKEKEKLAKLNEVSGPVFKIKEDPRVTRVGKVLRKYSLDELPQLLNVLKGDMSVVGPRPPVPKEVAEYTEYQKQRLKITPGLTCYWQVSNRDMEFDDWVKMDVDYINKVSLKEDVKLIIETMGFIVKGRNS